MPDGRHSAHAQGTCAPRKLVDRALLLDEGRGSLGELDVLLRAAGVPRIVRMRAPSEIESRLEGAPGAIFVDGEHPAQVLAVAKLARRRLLRSLVVAVGVPADPRHMFEYGRGGVSSFLEPPFDVDALRACLTSPPDAIGALAGVLVGRMGLKEAQQELRLRMVTQALHLCSGSRRSAARLLDVTRPAIQRILREAEKELAEG